MPPGEAAEGDVWEGADEVQVPDDGKCRRRRWELEAVFSLMLMFFSCLPSEPVMHKQEGEGEEQ